MVKPKSKLRRKTSFDRQRGATIRVANFATADESDLVYWRAKTPAARLRELERLRQFNYGYGQGKPLPRFQRVLKVTQLGQG